MAHVLPIAPVLLPTLDELAADPTRATSLAPTALHGLLCRCLTVQTALMGALLTASAHAANTTSQPDRLLKVDAAAKRLGISED